MIEISVQQRMDVLWGYLCDNYKEYMHIARPSYEINRKEIAHSGSRVITARMNTQYRVDTIEEPIHSSMILYEDHFNYYIKSVWGRHIDKLGVQILVDHSILHEMIHHIRNMNAYHNTKKHPSKYQISSYQDYLNYMGGSTDEYITELITIHILSKFYDVYSPLKPLYDGSYAKFKNKEDPTYMYRLSYINLYDTEKELLQVPSKQVIEVAEQCNFIIAYQIQEASDSKFTSLRFV